MEGVAQVAVGSVHACVRETSGVVQCWGYNAQGQLGRELDDYAERDFVPAPPDGLGRATHIQALHERTCAVVDRQTWCWGSYEEAERALHREERLDADRFELSVGGGCALRRGELECWGLPEGLADVLAPQRIDLPS